MDVKPVIIHAALSRHIELPNEKQVAAFGDLVKCVVAAIHSANVECDEVNLPYAIAEDLARCVASGDIRLD